MKIITLPPDDPYGNQLYQELDDYNATFGADTAKHENFLFAVKDESGGILGGAQGRISSDWLAVYSLYSTRTQKGVGTALMDYIETYAKEKKCKGVHITTFEFQAPEFYKKRGYEIFGELADYAGSYTNYYLKKIL